MDRPTLNWQNWRRLPTEDVGCEYHTDGWSIYTGWPAKAGANIMTTVEIWFLSPASHRRLVMAKHRVNVMSTSARNQIAVAMRRVATSPDAVEGIVQQVFADLLHWYERTKEVHTVTPAKLNGRQWLLYPLWPDTGVTGIVAAPGSFKSLIAQAAAVQLATGREILAGNTRPNPEPKKVLFLDWESDEHTFAARLYSLGGPDRIPNLFYKAMRLPLPDVAPRMAEVVSEQGFQAVVLDSLSASIGGNLIDAEAVNAFYDSCHLLGVPVLMLAHKSAENNRSRTPRFFGSVMSEARVRLAWNVERAPGANEVVWEVFKDNNHGTHGNKVAWRVDLEHEGEHENRHLVSTSFQAINPSDIRLDTGGGTVAERIINVLLREGPMLAGEIAQRVETSQGTVRVTLNRSPADFRKLPDDRWEAV